MASPETTEERPEDSTPPPPQTAKADHRRQLLSALRPYLSDGRTRALDSMLAIAEVLGTLRSV